MDADPDGVGVVLVLEAEQRVGVLAQRQASGEGGEGRAGEGGGTFEDLKDGRWARGGVGRRKDKLTGGQEAKPQDQVVCNLFQEY